MECELGPRFDFATTQTPEGKGKQQKTHHQEAIGMVQMPNLESTRRSTSGEERERIGGDRTKRLLQLIRLLPKLQREIQVRER